MTSSFTDYLLFPETFYLTLHVYSPITIIITITTTTTKKQKKRDR